jgi:hypothetical protein
MECSIVRELLPAYIEGITCKETTEDIRKHLETCEGCRYIYENMAAVLPRYAMTADIEKKQVEKLKNRLRRNNAIAVLITCVVFFIIIFSIFYNVTLPFDANRMFVRPVPSVFIYDEKDGKMGLSSLKDLNLKGTEEFRTGKYKTYNLAQFSFKGINNVTSTSRSRTLEQDGKKVRISYFCYYKTIWDIIFSGDASNYSDSGTFFGDVYDDQFPEKDQEYIPIQTEIYYLRDRDLLEAQKIDKLSDDEFTALKNKAYLVWSGVS